MNRRLCLDVSFAPRSARTSAEGLHTLRDYARDAFLLTQGFDRMVSSVGTSSMQRRPSQETPCPVTLPGLVALDKLAVIYRAIGGVQRVCPSSASIVRET